MAIPHQALTMNFNNPLKAGNTWRINFSRVQWPVSYTHLDVYKRQEINRKVLADLAMNHPEAFKAIVAKAKAA